MTKAQNLNQIFTRRWTVPIMAQLANTNGCKFVTLTKSLEGSRTSLKSSLELLDTLGLVKPNSGQGHPMRPEYVLTARGKLVSNPAFVLIQTLDKTNSINIGLKKWSMPMIHAVGSGLDRFGAIADELQAASDRAVSLALSDLHSVALLQSNLVAGRPPRNAYALTRKSKRIAPILDDLYSAMLG